MNAQNPHFDIFCHNLLLLRKRHGLTQYAMAKKLGIGIASLQKIEAGTVPPKLLCDVLDRIYQEFGISPSHIFLPIDESGAREGSA